MDSALEGDGFELPVPQQIRSRFLASSPVSHDRVDGLATRNRRFESVSLQRGVRCELDPTASAQARRARPAARAARGRAGVGDPQVEAAFAAVAREDFLGPGPWHIVRWGGGYRATPDADPIYLYTDDVIGILPRRNLNNGSPRFMRR